MGQSIVEDAETPANIPLTAKYVRSFAYSTMKDRVPVILTKALDGLVRDKDNIKTTYGEESAEELKSVIGYISQLKNEILTNKPFTSLSSVGEDADLWNQHLENTTKESGVIPSYFETDWMYAECYVYRRLREAFLTSKHLKNLDPFHRDKVGALLQSLEAIKPLALYMNEVVSSNQFTTTDEIKDGVLHLLKIALWGNKCDLSLSSGGAVSIKGNPFSLIDEYNSSLLVDESEEIWKILAASKGGTVDIILDNAGYEVVSDLCLAEFLISKCNVSKIRFRAKKMPWYVSDVMEKDFHLVINMLAEKGEPFAEMSGRWLSYVNQGVFELISDTFWTLPFCYSHMEQIDKVLYNDLKTSKLLIFKGDLNYRKLVNDINWPTTNLFKDALMGFHPAPLATLRTLKADTICGLRPGQAEEVEKKCLIWKFSGDFAVIQFDSEKIST